MICTNYDGAHRHIGTHTRTHRRAHTHTHTKTRINHWGLTKFVHPKNGKIVHVSELELPIHIKENNGDSNDGKRA